MQEKIYIKPKAEHIAFYSEEEITAVAEPVDKYAYADDGIIGEGGISGGMGTGSDNEEGVRPE